MQRKEILTYLVNKICKIQKHHPLRIAIDGIDAAGKTTLANELAKELEQKGYSVIRASIDGFHNPKEMRYKRGRDSALGYYLDSFNNQAIIDLLLKPLSDKGNLQYKTAIFDFVTNNIKEMPYLSAEKNSILIMEGVFLLRPELLEFWDLKIFIDADFAVTLERAAKRDEYYLSNKDEIIEKYNKRYIPGQKIYFLDANPKKKADIIIDNNNFEDIKIVKDILN